MRYLPTNYERSKLAGSGNDKHTVEETIKVI